MAQLSEIGDFAPRFVATADARRLVETILGTRGRLAVTGGSPASEDELLRVAHAQLCDREMPGIGYRSMERGASVAALFTRNGESLAVEPARGRVARADALER